MDEEHRVRSWEMWVEAVEDGLARMLDQARGDFGVQRLRVRISARDVHEQSHRASFTVDPAHADGGRSSFLRRLPQHVRGLGVPFAGWVVVAIEPARGGRAAVSHGWVVDVASERRTDDPDVRAAFRMMGRHIGDLQEHQRESMRRMNEMVGAASSIVEANVHALHAVVQTGAPPVAPSGPSEGAWTELLETALLVMKGAFGQRGSGAGVAPEPVAPSPPERFDAWKVAGIDVSE